MYSDECGTYHIWCWYSVIPPLRVYKQVLSQIRLIPIRKLLLPSSIGFILICGCCWRHHFSKETEPSCTLRDDGTRYRIPHIPKKRDRDWPANANPQKLTILHQFDQFLTHQTTPFEDGSQSGFRTIAIHSHHLKIWVYTTQCMANVIYKTDD